MPDVAADLRMRLANDPGRLIDRVEPWDSCHVAHALIVRHVWRIARRIAARLCPDRRTKKPAISRGLAISADVLSRGMSSLLRRERDRHVPADGVEQLLERIHGGAHLAGQYLAEPAIVDSHRLGSRVGGLEPGRGIETIRCRLDADGSVLVWDDVAGHYTHCHSLGQSAIRRIRRIAKERG